jgi:hypothetical protein
VCAISQWELKVAKWEQELQGKEEEIDNKLECKRNEHTSCADNLKAHETALEREWKHLKKMQEDLCNCELTISIQDGTLEHRATALTSKERELAN